MAGPVLAVVAYVIVPTRQLVGLVSWMVLLHHGLVADAMAQSRAKMPRGAAVDRFSSPRDLYREALVLGTRSQRDAGHYEVDLGPALDHILGYVHAVGIPLRPAPELTGGHGIAFSATWQVDRDVPSVNFHVGDTGPLDAFYGNDGGFRWALSWPLHGVPRVALHLAGGEDNEFGSWAVAGLQWRDRKRPLVVGIGLPLSMAEANGPLGVMCQIRLLLD
jgi:hypothetical protein